MDAGSMMRNRLVTTGVVCNVLSAIDGATERLRIERLLWSAFSWMTTKRARSFSRVETSARVNFIRDRSYKIIM